ncbi:putative ORfan [Saudi moumouvirus]|uniref:Uncharacterized protein n=1 Tax=Moumouvirus sp. 'Monve' TaxID=1128131 RepID=H2EFH7_9VIRU|nr:hypothetical protein mv_R1040 [Moumouvirus Monve]AQN67950.1 putative ORfan [Saudi moumouvirus]
MSFKSVNYNLPKDNSLRPVNLNLPKTDYSKPSFTYGVSGVGGNNFTSIGGGIEKTWDVSPKVTLGASASHSSTFVSGHHFTNNNIGASFSFNFLGGN